MRTNYFRTLLTVTSAALLCATTFISSQSPTSALAETKKPTKGQDVGDEKCERIDSAESSTFGRCKNVCKDKDVTWDAVGKRYVCSATRTVVRHPFGQVVPVGGVKVQDSGASQTPKRQPIADTKAKKAKKH